MMILKNNFPMVHLNERRLIFFSTENFIGVKDLNTQ